MVEDLPFSHEKLRPTCANWLLRFSDQNVSPVLVCLVYNMSGVVKSVTLELESQGHHRC